MTFAEMIAAWERRADGQHVHISEHWPFVMVDQRHCQPDTVEKAYWHYGYMTALRDVVRMARGDDLPKADQEL